MGIDEKYAYMSPNMYISYPPEKVCEVYSERTSGLRFDFLDVFQMNVKLTDTFFLPLVMVERKSGPIMGEKLAEKLKFGEIKDYGMGIVTNAFIAWFIHAITQGIFVVQFLYGMTCMAFCKARGEEFKHLQPDYF